MNASALAILPLRRVDNCPHEVLELEPADPPSAPLGNALRTSDSLRCALALLEITVELAERAGAPSSTIASVRRQVKALRCAP